MAYPISSMSGWEVGEGVWFQRKGFYKNIMSLNYNDFPHLFIFFLLPAHYSNYSCEEQHSGSRNIMRNDCSIILCSERCRLCPALYIRQESRCSSSALSWGWEEGWNWLPGLWICLFNADIWSSWSLKRRNKESMQTKCSLGKWT